MVKNFYMLINMLQLLKMLKAKNKRTIYMFNGQQTLNKSKTWLIFPRSTQQYHHSVNNIKHNSFSLIPIKSVIYVGIKFDKTFSWNKR